MSELSPEELKALYKRYHALRVYAKDRVGFDDLMSELSREGEYFRAPCSGKYHLNREGGLFEHSLNVAETLLSLRQTLAPDISMETCVIVGLLHDLGKCGTWGKPLYIKNEPTEKQKKAGYSANPPYKHNENLVAMSVPLRSLYLIQPYITLTEQEYQAIAYHDGAYVPAHKDVACKEEALTLLVNYADTWSAFVKERGL